MSILALLISVALIGFVAWLLINFVPMAPGFKRVICIVAIVAVALLLLSATGILNHFTDMRVPRAD